MSDMIQTKLHQHGDLTTFERIQDCTPIIDDAKARHNQGMHGTSEVKHAARIPMVVIEKYLNENKISFYEFINNQEHIRRMVNNPDNSLFRIWPGRV